jgi:hypothetical protein
LVIILLNKNRSSRYQFLFNKAFSINAANAKNRII